MEDSEVPKKQTISLSKVPIMKNSFRDSFGTGKNMSPKAAFPNPVATSNKNRPKTDFP